MVLRMSALMLAVVLLFVSGIVVPETRTISEDASQYLANVIGIQAAVLPNEYNTLNAQLEDKSKAIAAREIAVTLREQDTQESDTAVFVLSVLLALVLVLIIINYILDFRRQSMTPGAQAVRV
jgi:hypothetical protein